DGTVTALNADGSVRYSVNPFGRLPGGVTLATGDLDGDGIDEVVVGAGVGGGPAVAVFDGATGRVVRAFFTFDPGFRGGVDVAVGDADGDGDADIIAGAGAGGGPAVAAFDFVTGAVVRSFFAFDPGFRGGVSVAYGDADGDGDADIIAGAGA